jgi:hypothetical protein
MWGSKARRKKAVKNWHTRAMLIDPKKTRITIVWTKTADIHDPTEN